MAQPAAYGSWRSPITTSLVLSSFVGLGELSKAHNGNALVWAESRPEQSGRTALVYKGEGGKNEEIIPDIKYNARTRVHEYGGGAYTVVQDGKAVVFSSIEGPLYRVDRHDDGTWSEPVQVSPKSDVFRYADFIARPHDPNVLVAVLEDHTNDTPATVATSIVALDMTQDEPRLHTVVSGTDFYSQPRFSPSGDWFSWVQWKHPDMPWDGSELWIAKTNKTNTGSHDIADIIQKDSAHKIAGQGGGKESVSQARWADDEDTLVFLSDRTGFYELYKWKDGNNVELVLDQPTGADVGSPDWIFGNSTHGTLAPGKWISIAKSGNLRTINLSTKSSAVIETPFISISDIQVLSPSRIGCIAASADQPTVVAVLDLDENSRQVSVTSIKASSDSSIDSGYVSRAQQIEYPTPDGSTAYGLYYPPRNKDYAGGLDGEAPPLITHCHGGPTSSAKRGLDYYVQFFTSRGFAYVDVDYGGSTGYGKRYRERLNKQWGVVDVQDTIACVEYLTLSGKADKKRVAITGGSAGGYTVLASLCDGDVFGAGISHYGVSDLKMLCDDTHKFESQYLFNLLGGTPDEVPQVYRDRSPLSKAQNISSPLLLLQGSIDKVVPPQQAYAIRDKILQTNPKAKVELIMFEGEGHGFRKAENKSKSMMAELEFVRQTFGIEGADQ
ncbi:hypothetical protein OIV83_005952 [Microbotryomycetes sp. JL201]|nr:hypothetical protein OIV83_005952 [Microbotryomycetes sp. JL201]